MYPLPWPYLTGTRGLAAKGRTDSLYIKHVCKRIYRYESNTNPNADANVNLNLASNLGIHF